MARTCWRTRVISWIIRLSSASWWTWRRECTICTRRCSIRTAILKVPTASSTAAGHSRSVYKSATLVASFPPNLQSKSGASFPHFEVQSPHTHFRVQPLLFPFPSFLWLSCKACRMPSKKRGRKFWFTFLTKLLFYCLVKMGKHLLRLLIAR